jgi:hypothetical protein
MDNCPTGIKKLFGYMFGKSAQYEHWSGAAVSLAPEVVERVRLDCEWKRLQLAELKLEH